MSTRRAPSRWRTMESFVNAEHFEALRSWCPRRHRLHHATSPWTLPNGTFMRQYRRQPPSETSHFFRCKHVSLGMMATAVHRRTGSHGAQIESSARDGLQMVHVAWPPIACRHDRTGQQGVARTYRITVYPLWCVDLLPCACLLASLALRRRGG